MTGTIGPIHSRKFLHNVSRLRRRMGEDLGAEIGFVDRSDDPAVIDTFVTMEGAGYKGRNGIALVAHPDETAWFTDMCARFQAAGRLRVYTLEGAGRTLAIELGLRAADGLFLLKLSYDEAFAKYTPGIQLHLEVLDRFDTFAGVQWIDSCTFEGNQTMLRMYPDRRPVGALVVAVGGVPDRGVLRTRRLDPTHPGSPGRRGGRRGTGPGGRRRGPRLRRALGFFRRWPCCRSAPVPWLIAGGPGRTGPLGVPPSASSGGAWHPRVVQERETAVAGGPDTGVEGPLTVHARFDRPTTAGDLLVAAVIDGVQTSGMTQPEMLLPHWTPGRDVIGGNTADGGTGGYATGGLQSAIYLYPDNPGGLLSLAVAEVPRGTASDVTVVLAELSGVPRKVSVDVTGGSTQRADRRHR
jgi:hypothetical protein